MRGIQKIKNEFIYEEPSKFKFKIGRTLPTGLTGFILGILLASFVWILAIFLLRRFM